MDNTTLSKYFRSESVELSRSIIKPAEYNPRIWDDEARKNIKRAIRKYCITGGIVVNKRTGYTLVSG